jgi:hypothetical protein
MIAGGIIFTVSTGLIYTITVDSLTEKLISYSLIYAFSTGAGVQSECSKLWSIDTLY